MTKTVHLRLADIRGFQRLAVDATVGMADLVEAMHHTIVRTPSPLGKSPRGRTNGITGLAYRSVRGVTRLVGGSLDALLGLVAPLVRERPSSEEREAVLAALNGVLGDYLAVSGNPLAITLSVRVRGTPVALARDALAAAFPAPGRKVLVLVHGLCMNDLQWRREGHDHGVALARDLGFTPVYLHYNTGRRIPANGRELGALMEALVREWPHPVDELAIVGHSMGGLVARSACHYAAIDGQAWLTRLGHLVMLGAPHFGAPLERAGARVDYLLGASPYTAPFARLGKARSAGIKDLSHGWLRDEDPQAAPGKGARAPRGPLPEGVRCYAIAASRQAGPPRTGGRMRGDGLVPVDSALGRHVDPAFDLGLPEANRWIGHGMGHFDLLVHPEVCDRIRTWLATP